MRKRSQFIIIGIIVAVLVALFAIPPVRSAVYTPLLFINISVPVGGWRPLELITSEPTLEEYVIESASGRTLKIDIYVPPGSDERAAMLISVPLAGGGQRDLRLANLAQSLAQTGFVVMVPWYEGKEGILSSDDVEDVVSSFQFLLQHDRVDPTRAGLFAISYGNGPVFVAAADERIHDNVHFIVSFAGYYELSEAMRYVITGQYAYGDIRETLEPELWVKDLARKNLLSFELSDDEASAFFDQPDRYDELLELQPELRSSMQNLSPANVIDRIDAQTLIAHSTGDRTIPYTESFRLNDALSDRVPTTLTIVNIFQHGQTIPITPKTIFKNYLPSFVSGAGFLYNLLSFTWRS